MLDVRLASVDFPALVDELTMHHGFTEEAIARRIGCRRGAIGGWRRDRSIPRWDTGWRLLCLWVSYTRKRPEEAPRT